MQLQDKICSAGDATGYRMHLEAVAIDEVELRWGRYVAPREKRLRFSPQKSAIVTHFRIEDPGAEKEKQFVVFREGQQPYDLRIQPTGTRTRSFFELLVTDGFYDRLFTEESRFMQRFRKDTRINTPSPDFTADITAPMLEIIGGLRKHPFTGRLQQLYMETKVTELFLLQIERLDRSDKPIKLKKNDVAVLHDIKNYLETNFDRELSIAGLAQRAGINQMKLKTGFKELFHTTVFGYLHHVRMQEARRLLLDEKMYVGEVADRIGYKHPHHFTAAFKKEFGILPKMLKY